MSVPDRSGQPLSPSPGVGHDPSPDHRLPRAGRRAEQSGAVRRAGPASRERVVGSIGSSAFEDGTRLVVGCWHSSPIGAFGDVMWVTPEHERILLTASREAADFVTAIYEFDSVRVGRLEVRSDGRSTLVDSSRLTMSLVGGRRIPVMITRPLSFTRFVEGPLARALLGVETFGVSPTGAREWYQARSLRWVTDGRAAVDGRSLGSQMAIREPVGVGFSEPPHRPSIVSLSVTIEMP